MKDRDLFGPPTTSENIQMLRESIAEYSITTSPLDPEEDHEAAEYLIGEAQSRANHLKTHSQDLVDIARGLLEDLQKY